MPTAIQQLGESENPVAFVSRQYVAQTIDDLRFNLSNHCTGLAKAISPIIQKELDFVVNRFFQDEEIVQQLALHNSKSFWKVPERILQDRDSRCVNLTRRRQGAAGSRLGRSSVDSYLPWWKTTAVFPVN
ncbi:MAG: hypothetical protein R3C53_00640 [Pirellulaceae bacterium]